MIARPGPLHGLRRAASSLEASSPQQCRNFILSALPNIAGPGSTQTIETRRTLPYPPAQVYMLIADVDSYRHFLPHCTNSRVTKWTKQSAEGGRRWPRQADLTVGWGPLTESYTSRLYCIPGSIVEAVSGKASTTIPPNILAKHGLETDDGPKTMPGVFESLVTRWTVEPTATGARPGPPYGGPEANWTSVTLRVQFQFANAGLGLAFSHVADGVVEEVAQAFEDRARKLCGQRT